MDTRTFNQFRSLVYDRSGIHLNEKKTTLVCARVGKRMRALGMDDYRAYLNLVLEDDDGEEIHHLLDAISTNVTSFYREPAAFDFLKERVAEWSHQGERRFRFWSAACSTGEEPYTIAMTVLEMLAGLTSDVRVLATDISTRVLKEALEGVYPEGRLRPVPQELKMRYFHRESRHGEPLKFRIKDAVRERVHFNRINLSSPPFPMRGPFDVVFCRNVMIYFDHTVRDRLLADIERLLKPGGILIVGQSESLTGSTTRLKSVRPSIYAKEG